MASIKDIVGQEEHLHQSGVLNEVHLWTEGTFLRAYGWSAFLFSRYLGQLKPVKRKYKDIEQDVIYIGFPLTSREKWMPEGEEMEKIDDKHCVLRLSARIVSDAPEVLEAAYTEWADSVPVTEQQKGMRKNGGTRGDDESTAEERMPPSTMTGIMQLILNWQVENHTPMEAMNFIAEVKRRLMQLV